jgi:hypothetical protein
MVVRGLDPFSAATAEEIFSAFPEWRPLARIQEADDGTASLVIEVVPPVDANVEHGLIIDTSNGEVTVGFDHYHSHFDRWSGDGEHFGTRIALEFVRQILEERVSIVSWWLNERWCGSASLEVCSFPEAPS